MPMPIFVNGVTKHRAALRTVGTLRGNSMSKIKKQMINNTDAKLCKALKSIPFSLHPLSHLDCYGAVVFDFRGNILHNMSGVLWLSSIHLFISFDILGTK